MGRDGAQGFPHRTLGNGIRADTIRDLAVVKYLGFLVPESCLCSFCAGVFGDERVLMCIVIG